MARKTLYILLCVRRPFLGPSSSCGHRNAGGQLKGVLFVSVKFLYIINCVVSESSTYSLTAIHSRSKQTSHQTIGSSIVFADRKIFQRKQRQNCWTLTSVQYINKFFLPLSDTSPLFSDQRILYTGCPRRNGQNFGSVFLMLNYTDITQNTYIQS